MASPLIGVLPAAPGKGGTEPAKALRKMNSRPLPGQRFTPELPEAGPSAWNSGVSGGCSLPHSFLPSRFSGGLTQARILACWSEVIQSPIVTGNTDKSWILTL